MSEGWNQHELYLRSLLDQIRVLYSFHSSTSHRQFSGEDKAGNRDKLQPRRREKIACPHVRYKAGYKWTGEDTENSVTNELEREKIQWFWS